MERSLENENDLVTRLHWFTTNFTGDSRGVVVLQAIVAEAMAEIERLRAELKDCRAVRDSWCAAYTELRDNPKQPAN